MFLITARRAGKRDVRVRQDSLTGRPEAHRQIYLRGVTDFIALRLSLLY